MSEGARHAGHGGFGGSRALLFFSLTPKRAVAIIVVRVEIGEVFTAIVVAVRWLWITLRQRFPVLFVA